MYKYIPLRKTISWADFLVLAFLAIIFYGILSVAQQTGGQFSPSPEIDLSASALPKYAVFSLLRAAAAYTVSLIFTLVYGYVAARFKRAEPVLIPLLDILQSVPVFGFLPGLILGLIYIFPNSQIGLEIACVLMIFSSQAWNMTFSFYDSLKTVPQDLQDAARVINLNWFQRLWRLEIPFSAVGLAWNSLVSVAGGWFFLTICESPLVGRRQFRLPGIGSYIGVAIEKNDSTAMLNGVIAMFLIIIFVDFLIWRPVMVWVRRFQTDLNNEDIAEMPFIASLLRESWIVSRLRFNIRQIFKAKRIRRGLKSVGISGSKKKESSALKASMFDSLMLKNQPTFFSKNISLIMKFLPKIITVFGIFFVLWSGTRLWELVRDLKFDDWKTIGTASMVTLLRVICALTLSSLWTIPVGIMIGMNSRLTRFFQPIVQIAASFPVPMLFPWIIGILVKNNLVGVDRFGWVSVVLMFLAVQWYILFNVLAGAMMISKDLDDGVKSLGISKLGRWFKLYLPAVFPSLVTGWITAAGGAWNASIVAEIVQYDGRVYETFGVGSMMSRATETGNFALLAGCVIGMVATVIILNRTFWRTLYEFADSRFRLTM